jgi:hypothetical protein
VASRVVLSYIQLVSTFLYIVMSATFKRSYDNIVLHVHNFKDSHLLHVCNCSDVKLHDTPRAAVLHEKYTVLKLAYFSKRQTAA